MESNSSRFLYAFNRIEKHLRNIISSRDYITFSKMVVMLKRSHAIVRRYSDDLLEFAELRNAIVHERTEPNYAIAEPHERIVTLIEMIENELTQPKTVIPLFSKEVYALQSYESLSRVLYKIKQSTITRFPVYDKDRFVGLITANGITHWLAQNVEEDIISIEETRLNELLQFEGAANNYCFIGRDASIYEAADLFKDRFHTGQKLDAILITESGNQDESLLGIITLADIMNIP